MARAPTNANKERVCLYVDKEVVAYFKATAEANEQAYQPLMNKVLRDYFNTLPDADKYRNPMK